jgi:geranylgeranyl reductase family protein
MMHADAVDADAVVVGGGPAGAAAAARLAAAGFSAILVDRATFPRDKVCGDFVGPAALAELADLGVAAAADFRETNKIGDLALHADGLKLAGGLLPHVPGLPSYGRVIPRLQLDAWVLQAARRAGATVLCGRRVTAIGRAPGAVTVRGLGAPGPWELRARLLLGADGSNSTVARALRGAPPPSRDRILAVRAYFDDVTGPADQVDLYCCADSFPGYHWLFPAGDGRANVGVGMVQVTYPRGRRNLRELLLRLIAEDAALRQRLRGARMRDGVLGSPLTTYDPKLSLVGERVMLLGDAAGLINPLNGEGIQYALQSARWAVDVAADRLRCGELDASALAAYERRVHQSLRQDMALSRLVIQVIRNRALNPVWLQALRIIGARARTDPDYAYRVGCVLTGLAPAIGTLGVGVAAKTVKQALLTPWPRTSRRHTVTGPDAVGAREFAEWAAGAGRALAEFVREGYCGSSCASSGMPGSGPGSWPAAAAWRRAR